MMDIRPSPIAGRWYAGQPSELRERVDHFLANVTLPTPRPPAEAIVALIAPHAGHLYSGGVAAHAFALVRGRAVETVAILCPSHFHADGWCLTTAHEAYATPLGEVAVDHAALAQIRASLSAALGLPPHTALAAIRRDREHAIEIELPFLQVVLAPGFRLIPIMLREQTALVAQALGRALAELLRGRSALIVGSSDLSHFYPQTTANALDAVMLAQIGANNPAGVLQVEADGRGCACGHGAVAAALWAAQALGATQAHVLHYATSGDVGGDYAQVVGYGAAALWKD
jgi:hypothetical protein